MSTLLVVSHGGTAVEGGVRLPPMWLLPLEGVLCNKSGLLAARNIVQSVVVGCYLSAPKLINPNPSYTCPEAGHRA